MCCEESTFCYSFALHFVVHVLLIVVIPQVICTVVYHTIVVICTLVPNSRWMKVSLSCSAYYHYGSSLSLKCIDFIIHSSHYIALLPHSERHIFAGFSKITPIHLFLTCLSIFCNSVFSSSFLRHMFHLYSIV